ncbi:hypothetical protein PRK78_005162 [Emydomyces testavorans]|uniref:Uncharacterized protein n=1 Tax=Emydomyces testavorans TaxID=2070801 RepID=A0AAF0IJS8_9EURO|nr:hypothetical protein PRK78_005162 [Emydomyces testavorans]
MASRRRQGRENREDNKLYIAEDKPENVVSDEVGNMGTFGCGDVIDGGEDEARKTQSLRRI